MASPAVVAAFEAALAADWSETPIIAENASDGDAPADGSAFLFVHYPYASRDQISVGAPGTNVFREEGAARLVLNVARGSGLDQGHQWAQQLVELFIGRDLGGVIVRAIDGPATDDRNESGNYYRLAIAIAYEHDFLG